MTAGNWIGAVVCTLAIVSVVGGLIAGWRMESAISRVEENTVHDVFTGSGAVAAAADGMLALMGADRTIGASDD